MIFSFKIIRKFIKVKGLGSQLVIFDLDPSFLKVHVKLHPRIPTALHFIMYTTEQAL